MKFNSLFLMFLFIFPLYSQENIEIINQPSVQYVTMEFQEDYDRIFERIDFFLDECKKQHLFSKIQGNLFVVFLGDRIPVWRLGFPIEEGITVRPPLQIARMDSMKMAKNSRPILIPQMASARTTMAGPFRKNVETMIYRTICKIREMDLRINGPTQIAWLDDPRLHPGGNARAEIRVPIRDIGVTERIVSALYRFVVSTAAFLYVFFIIFLLTQKKGRKTSNILLACFLFSLFMGKLFDWNVGYYEYSVFVWFPHLFHVGGPFVYCIAPLLFLYAMSLLRPHFSWRKHHLLHFIPFAVVFVLMFVKFYRFDAQAKREIYRMGDIFPAWFELYGFIFLNIQTIGYIVAALLVLRSYRTEIKNRLSSVEKMNLPWLSFVLYALLVTHFTGTIKHFVYRYLGIYSEFLAAVLLTSYFFFPVIIVYYGLKNPEIFSGVEKDGTDKKWSLPKSYADHYAEKLRHFMETDKPYLTPGITIDDLAKRIGISPRNLSSILNTHFNRNFFDFINQYRVNEAKRRLADASEKHNVMQVLFDVGFNSKSAFYTAFKKYTGISPSRYQET